MIENIEAGRPHPFGDSMRLTCTSCGNLGEIVSMSDQDVAYYCRECGIVRDLAIVSDRPKLKLPSVDKRTWASTPEGLATIKSMRDSGMSLDEVAAELGVSRVILYRWAEKDDDLRTVLDIQHTGKGRGRRKH